jgi:APA family basic amino acid/polyamine antiporter
MAENERFARVLKSRDVIAVAFGAMIGWSWVLLTGYWVQTAGSVEHVYTYRALGSSWSFVCTWSLLFAYLVVCLFEAVALPTAMEYLLPQINLYPLWQFRGSDVTLGFICISLTGTLVMTIVNVRGIKTAAILQSIVTGAIFVAGLLLVTGAMSFGDLESAKPWFATPATGILKVLILVPAMLIGFDVIPQSTEEIDLPANRIGKLLILSVFIAVMWYVTISFAVAVALSPDQLLETSMATGDAASTLWGGSWAGTALILGGIGGIITSWNAFLIGASRVLYALAESGMVPAVLGRLHPRYKTPYISVIAIGVFSCLAPLLGRAVILWMVNAVSFAVVVAYLFVAISFLALRRNEPDMPRPFTVTYPRLVGYSAVILALALLSLYLPWSPSALMWPYEWGGLLSWAAIGLVFFLRFRSKAVSIPPVASRSQSVRLIPFL